VRKALNDLGRGNDDSARRAWATFDKYVSHKSSSSLLNAHCTVWKQSARHTATLADQAIQ
jgi:hypothetical protein